MDDLLAEFVAEATGTLSQLDKAALDFARSPGERAALSLIFRLVHTTKGTCGFLGLYRLERLAHATEDVLGAVRDGTIEAVPAVIDGVFAAIEKLRAIVAALDAFRAEPPGDDEAFIGYLDALASGRAGDPAPATRITQLSSAAAVPRRPFRSTREPSGRRPVGHAWNRLPRLVRKLAHDLGKSIELVTEGADTELDRHTLEQIAGPLAHMVRNSADHGLELPTERLACGKRPVGTIRLTAAEDADGHVVITVADDGRGLAVPRIRAQVVAQGLASAREVAAMSDAALARFVFSPGFSTATRITPVSGRGVGMDAVKTCIERIGGRIEVASAEGRGTSFRMILP